MATFLVAHGAWSAGWAWKKMRPLLRAKGHGIFTPTYTGLGERVHLASPHVDLETHIADMLSVLPFEDLREVVLIGHSYGGMVATGVADRAPERLAQLVYLDAFVPRNGQCLFDLLGAESSARMREAARTVGDGWRTPPSPVPPDTSGGRRLGHTTACDAAAQHARAARALDWRRQATPQSLYLLHAAETRGWLPAVCSARAHRDRLALLRDGREPQPAHHCA